MKSDYIDINGVRMHVRSAGAAGSPIVLFHGGGLDSSLLSWKLAIPALAHTHRVFATDMPGYGLSDRPAHFSHTIEAYVDLASKLMDQLGVERASVCGLSMGGAIALGFTLAHPQRVIKLVPVSSYGIQPQVASHILSYLVVRMPFISSLTYATLRRNRNWARSSLASIFHDKARISDDLAHDVFDEMQRPRTGDAFMALQKHEMLPARVRTNFVNRLPEIQAPALFVHGDKDALVPLACAQQAAAKIANARLHVMHNCGHWPQRESPEAFNAALTEFLHD